MPRMRCKLLLVSASLAIGALDVLAIAQAPPVPRFNRIITLLEQKKPVFGVYWPSNPSGRGRGGAPPPAEVAPKAPAEFAREALAYHDADFFFSGALEGGMDRGYAPVNDFVKATVDAVSQTRARFMSASTPLVVKVPKISADRAKAAADISRALNLGVSGMMFVEVESADEVRAGLAAMRFKSKGGTRADDVGDAPAFWGMSETEYKAEGRPVAAQSRRRADQLDDRREQGRAGEGPRDRRGEGHRRAVARRRHAARRVLDHQRRRRAHARRSGVGERDSAGAGGVQGIQRAVRLSRASANDIEMRMKQGFSVFVMNWGDAGFKTVEIGRKAAGR